MDTVISSEDKKEIRKNQIIFLITNYYQKLDFLHYESLDVLIDKALDLFLDSDYTIDEINEKIIEAIAERKKALIDRYDDDKVRDNHEMIYGRLEQLARLLNKLGVDYQLAGALCGYLKYNQESNRCHDDIDISLNEEDFEKFKTACTQMGLQFEDNRLQSPIVLKNHILHGDHEVTARDPNSSFHIGVFPYERKEDGSVVSKNYYHDENGNACVMEEEYSPVLASELFSGEKVDFRGTPLIISSPEQVYYRKQNTNQQKDQHDIVFLEDKIDHDKLMRIQNLSSKERKIRYLPISTLSSDKKDELGFMFQEESISSPTKDNTAIQIDKPKMLVKNNQNQANNTDGGEEGFISNAIITTLAIITFVLCFIGIAIIYLIQM